METDGLDPYHGNRIFCWSYMTELGEYGFMLKTPENIAWVQALFDDPTKKLVFHNAKFDLKMFSFEGIDVFNAKAEIHCTLILAKMWNGLMWGYDLRYLSIKLLGRAPTDKDEVDEWLKANRRAFSKEHGRSPTFKDAPIEVIKRRATWDTESTLCLFTFFYPRVQNICPKLYATERDLMFVCVDMENTGVQVDLTRTRKLRQEAIDGLDGLRKDIQAIVGDIQVTKKKKGVPIVVDVPADEFNPGSSQHMVGAFNKLGIELKYKTEPKKGKKGKRGSPGGNWAFDEYAMIRYVSKPLAGVIRDSSEEGWHLDRFYRTVHSVVRGHKLPERDLLLPLILKVRELSKMVTTYYDHIIESAVDVRVEPSGREVGILHCSFNQSEAMTGRFSSSNPNMQNMPRILGPRECFMPRRSRRNWHFDYSQVEMRLFAHFAKDPDMAKAVVDDIHYFVAQQIYGVEKPTKEQRKRAKAINFGILYGAGPKKIAETLTRRGLPTTVQEATVFCMKYHRRFPSIRRLTQQLQSELARNGFVTNPYGRRYHIDKREGYKSLNYICQGTPADMMKRAMVDIWKMLRAGGFKSRMLLTVHDELAIEIPPSEEKQVVPRIRDLMEDLHTYFVPVTVDAEVVTHRWSEKHDVENYGFQWN